ncbi:MAG TPA: hypothetical protein VNJ07_01250, partial [Chitinophagales bacterium]|nr:hypothetical protein [Chitinophagales bacterium]
MNFPIKRHSKPGNRDFSLIFIAAIARGGFAPARFLCDFLHVSDMASVQVKHYEAGADRQAKAWVKYPLNA